MTETIDLLSKNKIDKTALDMAVDVEMKSLLMLIPQKRYIASIAEILPTASPHSPQVHVSFSLDEMLLLEDTGEEVKSASTLMSKFGSKFKDYSSHNQLDTIVHNYKKIEMERLERKPRVLKRKVDEQAELRKSMAIAALSEDKKGRKMFEMVERASTVSSILDEDGSVKVDAQLRVKGLSNFYAIGDCTSVQEQKIIPNTEAQAQLVASNIIRAENGEELQVYEAGVARLQYVSIGKSRGLVLKGQHVLKESTYVNKMRQSAIQTFLTMLKQ